MLLNSAFSPVGDTEREIRPSVCGGRVRETCPDVESHCLIDPSADIDIAVSFGVQAISQMASVWARETTFSSECYI